MPSVYEQIAIAKVSCSYCGAQPGYPCLKPNGKIMAGCHWHRRDKLQNDWRRNHEKEYQDLLHGKECGLSSC